MNSHEYEKLGRSEAAQRMHDKLAGMIQRGNEHSLQFMDRLNREVPDDYIVSTGNLRFDILSNRVSVSTPDHQWFLHPNALSQMVTKTGILTNGVADKMLEAKTPQERWGCELLLHNLRTMYSKGTRDRVLIRVVNGEARAFFSDHYRRMDTRTIMSAFYVKSSEFGATPIETDSRVYRSSYFHDTRVGMSMFLPEVFEPLPNEFLIVGLICESSDFGCGALTVRMVLIRVVCTNLAIAQNEIRKVHLGARLPDEISFSQKTYELDTLTMASAVEDVVGALFSPDSVNKRINAISDMGQEDGINIRQVYDRLRGGGHLSKGEVEGIEQVYNEPDIHLMPAGNSLWRASNAIGLFANRLEDTGSVSRAVELRYVAGMMIDNAVNRKNAA